MTSHHDNSAENPDQQFHPPRDIHFGEATHEEMSIAFTLVSFDDQQLGVEPVMPEAMIAANRAKEAARVAAEAAAPSTPETAGSGR